ncbi:MAG: hypothetical protein Rubg2KO_22880 [Rubricoccaceae bacterium]
MRLALLSALALVVFTGCAATPQLDAGPAASAPSTADEIPAHLLGTWTYQAERSGQVINGDYVLTADPAGHRMGAPGLVSNDVQNSVLVVDGETVTWTGVLRTMGGPAGFRITGTLDGDTVTGTNEIDGLGTYAFSATKAQ